jgi:hypothetical protein
MVRAPSAFHLANYRCPYPAPEVKRAGLPFFRLCPIIRVIGVKFPVIAEIRRSCFQFNPCSGVLKVACGPSVFRNGYGNRGACAVSYPASSAAPAVFHLNIGRNPVHAAVVIRKKQTVGYAYGKALYISRQGALRPFRCQARIYGDFFFQIVKIGDNRLIRIAVPEIKNGASVAVIGLFVNQDPFHQVNSVSGQAIQQIQMLIPSGAVNMPGNQGRGDHKAPVQDGKGSAFGKGVALRLPGIGRGRAQGFLSAPAEVRRFGPERV